MKIAPPESKDALEELRARLQRGLPERQGGYWTVMIYQGRYGWVVRSQWRKVKQLVLNLS